MRNEKLGTSRAVMAVAMLAMASVAGLPRTAHAETTLRIGMTAADIPRTLGQPDQGFEGNRFTGLTMYDALTMWDLSSADNGPAGSWRGSLSVHRLYDLRSAGRLGNGCVGSARQTGAGPRHRMESR